jgi:hypothetical protein
MPAKKAKSTGAPVAKISGPIPSYIATNEGKFNVTKTPTGKIKVTAPNGATITFPKGTSIGKISSRLQSGDTMGAVASRVSGTKIKSPSGSTMKIRGGAGGAFLENLK